MIDQMTTYPTALLLWIDSRSASPYIHTRGIAISRPNRILAQTSRSLRTSTLIDHLYSHPLDGEIYSNDANAVYILTQASATSIPNFLPFEALKNSATALVQFRASIVADTGNSYLVWIDNERLLDPLSGPVNFDSVSSMFDLEEVEKFPDGGIYLFK